MDFTLNELSLSKLSSRDEAINVFMQLSDVTWSLRNIGFRSMKVWDISLFYNFDYSEGLTLISWLKKRHENSNQEKIKSQRLKLLIDKRQSELTDDERTLILDCPIVGIQLQNVQAITEGLKIACLQNTIAVSLNTSSEWNNSSLNLIHLEENEKGETLEQIVSVRHASALNHIDEQKDWLDYLIGHKLIGQAWNPSENYFPRLDYSNLLVENGNWETFRQKRDKTASYYERLAVIRDYGEKVAERNGYKQ